jgi:O-antigen/teichoic acid export membrane protein
MRNAASSYFAMAWLGGLSLITIPIYIRIVGINEWGLVAACLGLQILSGLVDIGFSQIVPRWIAREANDPARLVRLIAYLRLIYSGLAVTLFVALQIFAEYISHDWFRVSATDTDALEFVIRITSVQILFQFVNNLHIGIWNGLQRQVLANTLNCVFGTLKHTVALPALLLISPHASVYASSFACIAFVEVLLNATIMQRMLRNVNGDDTVAHLDLAPFLREASVMSVGVIVGLLTTSMDRIFLSRTVDATSFGIYTTVLALALFFLQLQAPITRAYFPSMVQQFQASGLMPWSIVRKVLAGSALLCALPALTACILAPQLLSIWLADAEFTARGTQPLQLLLLAIALNSLYNCVYMAIVAIGRSGTVLKFNLVGLAVTGIACIALNPKMDIINGGLIWLCNALVQIVLGIFWIAGKIFIRKNRN